MRVRVLQPFLYAADGIQSHEVQPGEVHDIAPLLVRGLREIGAVIPLDEPEQTMPLAPTVGGVPSAELPAEETSESEEEEEEDAPEEEDEPTPGKPRTGPRQKSKHRRR